MLFSFFQKKFNPQTKFPVPPEDRWNLNVGNKTWDGRLKNGDESYIFTKSVQDYLTYKGKTFIQGKKIDRDELVNEAIQSTKLAILNRCKKNGTEPIQSTLQAYILTILRNEIKTELEKLKNTPESLENANTFLKTNTHHNEIEKYYVKGEILNALETCIDNLNNLNQFILRSYYFYNISVEKISEKVRLNPQQIYYRIRLCEESLQQCLVNKGFDKSVLNL